MVMATVCVAGISVYTTKKQKELNIQNEYVMEMQQEITSIQYYIAQIQTAETRYIQYPTSQNASLLQKESDSLQKNIQTFKVKYGNAQEYKGELEELEELIASYKITLKAIDKNIHLVGYESKSGKTKEFETTYIKLIEEIKKTNNYVALSKVFKIQEINLEILKEANNSRFQAPNYVLSANVLSLFNGKNIRQNVSLGTLQRGADVCESVPSDAIMVHLDKIRCQQILIESLRFQMGSSSVVRQQLELYKNQFLQLEQLVADSTMQATHFSRISKTMVDTTELLKKKTEKEAESIQDKIQDLQQRATRLLWFVGILSISLPILLSLRLVRQILMPVKMLQEVTRSVGEGDLTQQTRINSRDELEELGDRFNEMMQSMRGAIQQMGNSSKTLAQSSRELTSVSKQSMDESERMNEVFLGIVSGARDQSRRLEESVQIMNTVSKHIHQTKDIADDIQGAAQQTKKESDKGAEVIFELNCQTTRFIEFAQILIGKIEGTVARTKEIDHIIDTISSITKKTELLALNARIEASHAGVYGKGFSVIANQIKQLSEHSKEETDNVRSLIQDIESHIKELSQEATLFQSLKESQSSSVSQTEKSFKTIQTQITSITENVDSLKDHTTQMTEMNKVLHCTIENVASVSEEMTSTSEDVSISSDKQKLLIAEVAKAASELEGVASELHQGVSRFKTN